MKTFQKSWRNKKQNKIRSLPLFYQIEAGNNYLFLFDENEWSLYEIMKFHKALSECFPENGFSFMPNTMALNNVSVTDKENIILNNVMNRIKENKTFN